MLIPVWSWPGQTEGHGGRLFLSSGLCFATNKPLVCAMSENASSSAVEGAYNLHLVLGANARSPNSQFQTLSCPEPPPGRQDPWQPSLLKLSSLDPPWTHALLPLPAYLLLPPLLHRPLGSPAPLSLPNSAQTARSLALFQRGDASRVPRDACVPPSDAWALTATGRSESQP